MTQIPQSDTPQRNPEVKSASADSDGFTMIELLVVIAIIGILASLLLPALTRAKGAGHRTSCVNRMKQWAVALQMYADDNQDFIPRESFIPGGTSINLWAQVRNPLAADIWYNTLPEYLGGRRAAAYAPLVMRDDARRDKMLHCPQARFPKGAARSEIAYFSYAMNSKLILNPASTVKFATIKTPGQTIAFLENRLPDEPKVDPKQESDDLGQPSAYATRFYTRHLNLGNLAFTDGHVESLPAKSVVHDGGVFFPQTHLVWTCDPNVNPNLVP